VLASSDLLEITDNLTWTYQARADIAGAWTISTPFIASRERLPLSLELRQPC
jgi:hypothetical protein